MAPKDIVPILTDAQDWPLWRLRVTDTLNRDDLTSVVTGHEKSPPPEIAVTPPTPTTASPPSTSPGAPAAASAPASTASSTTTHQVARRETWSWRNSRALSTIRDHLSGPLALELWEYEHASYVWQKLVKKFEQTNTGEMAVAELCKGTCGIVPVRPCLDGFQLIHTC